LGKQTETILAIKFMGTITTQPFSINEKIFWANKDEHVVLKIRNNKFIDKVKKMDSHVSKEFKDYNYAFILKKDTLYSDSTLKSWILKKGTENFYFYDKNGEIAESLRNTYSFFNSCW
jgi:hypothetical protein